MTKKRAEEDSGSEVRQHAVPIDRILSRRKLLWAALLWALVFGYWPSLNAPFLYDDIPNIVTNADLRHPTEPWRFFQSHYTTMQFDHRPLVGLVTMVNYQLGGLSPVSYRVVNLLLHWATALLIGEFILAFGRHFKLSAAKYIALPTAFLWALHPLNSVTVIFISGRTEIMMSLFFVLTLWFVLRAVPSASKRVGIGIVVSAMACLASKEVGVGLIVALVVLDRIAHFGSWKEQLIQRRVLYSALAVGWTGFIVWWASGERLAELGGNVLAQPWNYFRVQVEVLVHYISLVLWPEDLVFVHGVQPVGEVGDWLPPLVALAILFVFVVWYGRSRPALLIPGLLFFLVLGPTSSLMPIPQEPVAEWRMYLPSACVLVLLLVACKLVLSTAEHVSTRLVVFGLALVIGALATATHLRSRDYRTTTSIWRDTAMKQPGNVKAWHNLAVSHLAGGEFVEAAHCADYLQSAGRRQGDWFALASAAQIRGMVLLEGKKYMEAEGQFRLGLEEYPGDEKLQGELLRIGLARALVGQKKFYDVIELLGELNRVHPENPAIIEPLADALEGVGREAEAENLRAQLQGVPLAGD